MAAVPVAERDDRQSAMGQGAGDTQQEDPAGHLTAKESPFEPHGCVSTLELRRQTDESPVRSADDVIPALLGGESGYTLAVSSHAVQVEV